MITVAIIGILAAIAIPSYNDYVRRGTLPEAYEALSDYRAKLEQYYQDNRNYGTAAACGAGASGTWNTFPKTLKYFQFTCATANSGQSFTVTATGTNGAAIGHVFTIDQDGRRATSTFKGTSVTAACWLNGSRTC